jgi:hypothetical protein
MIEFMRIIAVVSCLYLSVLAMQFPQIVSHGSSKHAVLKTVAATGLTAACLLVVCVILLLILL